MIGGHIFDPCTRRCSCGIGECDVEDAKRPPSHDDVMHPGTVEATYRQRSTGRIITYRKRIK